MTIAVHTLRVVTLAAALITLSALDLHAQATLPGDLSGERSTVLDEAALTERARAVGGLPRLTPSDARQPEAIRRNLSATLAALGVDASTANSLSALTINELDRDGRLYVESEQRIGRLRVIGGTVRAVYSGNGNLFHLIYRLGPVTEASPRAPTIRSRIALSRAVGFAFDAGAPTPRQERTNGITTTFRQDRYFSEAPTVELVIVAKKNAPLEQGYRVKIWRRSDNLLYHTLIDGRGVVLANEKRTWNDEYRVFPKGPLVGLQTLPGPAPNPGAPSPNGWVKLPSKAASIAGNNVHAYLDWEDLNAPVLFGNDVTDGRFVGEPDPLIDPLNQQNTLVAVQNVFYHANFAHDRLWEAGFNEAFGNAQVDNFGRGGKGNDHVRAEAQNGVAATPPTLNNANVGVPGDGSSPRMQYFLFTATTPRRDSSIEADIIYHEYGHIAVIRMVDLSLPNIGGAINEGFADTVAILLTDDDRLGEYVLNSPGGFRRQRYTGYTNTLSDFNPTLDVHDNGEIYAAAMWRWHQKMNYEGWDEKEQLRLAIHGLRMTALAPTFIDMRNGLLAATGQDVECLVWNAFAEQGMGLGATMDSTGTQITESNDPGGLCTFEPRIAISNASVTEGDKLTFTVTLSKPWVVRVDVAFETGDVRAPDATSGPPAFADSLDYDATSGVLSFMPGETQKTIIVQTRADNIFELQERMAVRLMRPMGTVRLSDNQGVGSIKNRLVNSPN